MAEYAVFFEGNIRIEANSEDEAEAKVRDLFGEADDLDCRSFCFDDDDKEEDDE